MPAQRPVLSYVQLEQSLRTILPRCPQSFAPGKSPSHQAGWSDALTVPLDLWSSESGPLWSRKSFHRHGRFLYRIGILGVCLFVASSLSEPVCPGQPTSVWSTNEFAARKRVSRELCRARRGAEAHDRSRTPARTLHTRHTRGKSFVETRRVAPLTTSQSTSRWHHRRPVGKTAVNWRQRTSRFHTSRFWGWEHRVFSLCCGATPSGVRAVAAMASVHPVPLRVGRRRSTFEGDLPGEAPHQRMQDRLRRA
jgi:hypothetical protein